ncbi:MAG: ankyrin repeat domain-containing protein, partial [Burkholderiaceae bacterium]
KDDVNIADNDKRTALHWASVKNNQETVDLLIAAGADVNAKDKDGRTPLSWAIKKENKGIADKLAAAGGKQ